VQQSAIATKTSKQRFAEAPAACVHKPATVLSQAWLLCPHPTASSIQSQHFRSAVGILDIPITGTQLLRSAGVFLAPGMLREGADRIKHLRLLHAWYCTLKRLAMVLGS
jgi:hypothetical protein